MSAASVISWMLARSPRPSAISCTAASTSACLVRHRHRRARRPPQADLPHRGDPGHGYRQALQASAGHRRRRPRRRRCPGWGWPARSACHRRLRERTARHHRDRRRPGRGARGPRRVSPHHPRAAL